MEGSIWILLGALVIVLLLVIGLIGIQAQTMRKRSRRQMQEWQEEKQGMQAQLQKEQERMAGMEMGLSLMLQCREIWVFGERMSEGMLREISYAVRHGILTRYFSGADGNFSERSAGR